MSKLNLLVRTATTFSKTGEIDEEALRRYLQRFVDANIGVYLGSGGSGEGHALTWEELGRVYRIGVEVCKGKVPVHANPPEQHTAKATREHTLYAVKAGVEFVNVYGPTAWHGFRPTDAEFLAYFDEVLPAIKHTVAIAPNPIIGYTPRPALIAAVCNKYSQIVAVNFAGLTDDYFIQLKDLLDRELACYLPLTGSPNTLALGAAGLIGGAYNILPKTFRQYLDSYERRKFDELGVVYAHLKRFAHLVEPWNTSTPRWIKMCMKVLKLPGGEGGLREPYRMPSDEELRKFTDDLLRLRIPEIEEQAVRVGLVIPR